MIQNQFMSAVNLPFGVMGNHHFCIKNSTSNDILNSMDTSFYETSLYDTVNFDNNFLYGKNPWSVKLEEKRFLLSDKIRNWNYLQWNVTDFEENKSFAPQLSEKLKTEVYYFFDDPWVATLKWILTDNGRIIKSYSESHGQVFSNEGYFEPEEKIRNEYIKDGAVEFDEGKLYRLYEEICQPLHLVNEPVSNLIIKGELR